MKFIYVSLIFGIIGSASATEFVVDAKKMCLLGTDPKIQLKPPYWVKYKDLNGTEKVFTKDWVIVPNLKSIKVKIIKCK